MQPQEFEDAKLLWKKYYAVECFKHAQTAAEYLLQNDIRQDNPLYVPLITAVYSLYGRPFKCSRGVGSLGKEIIPPGHLQLHDEILTHRDKIYVHSDAVKFELAGVGQANQVRVKRLPTETLLQRSQYLATPERLPQIVELCKELQEKMLSDVNQMFAQYGKLLPAKLGEHILNIEDPKGDFWKPAPSVIHEVT